FGCRATQADGAAIERQFIERGLARSETAQEASVVVLNTCTVTASADQDVRNSIRRIHRQNPACKIVVTGCYAQRAPEELASIPGVNWVIGNSHKHQVGEVACSGSSQFLPLAQVGMTPSPAAGEILVGDIFAHTELMAAPVFDADTASEKTRPNLKVQDGCNNRCSFCIIPSVRGRSRSLPDIAVISEVKALVGMGYREVVISGINLGRWGRDLRESSKFASLVRSILGQTSLEKLRISSVEPMDWTDELIELCASSPRIAKHAHVPMQSGSDRVLRLMHRKYRPWHYREKIEKIRAAMPSAAVGADVMVGFPGETDADFEETRQFIASLPMTYLHVFTFSARPGTPAAAMPNQVHPQVMKERNRVLRELAAAKKREFQQGFIGKTLEAITLTHFNGTHTECLTDNFQKLWLEGKWEANQWVKAGILDIETESLIGQNREPWGGIVDDQPAIIGLNRPQRTYSAD
ncbi:MAG TPA: tRNA (N(6)-L-threonylcarbamoyladenosine(37)-C(2))-methylthiotransferase MtaB, partial [Terriglobales bacterium]|nr:tRNA (N(6)-L-threonylcarbamoyladenosine(37)-C(2))-methylthiotransferase MtaB [Terriglobales bacterium]